MGKNSAVGIAGCLIAGILFCAGAFSRAEAVEASHPVGLYLGADLLIDIPENDLSGDFVKVDPGAGFDLKIGYIFPIHLALEAELGFSGHKVEDEGAGIGFLAVDLRYFPFRFSFADRPLYPYLRVGIGRYALAIDNLQDSSGRRADLRLTGKGIDVGVGFDFYLGPNVSLEAGVTQRFIRYDHLDFLDTPLIDDVKGEMTTLNGGVKYHF